MEVILMIIIMRGEVYLDDAHIPLINSEEEYVKQRYFTVAKTIAPHLLRITRKCSCRNEYSKQETVGEDNE
jgi:hypothetical protein